MEQFVIDSMAKKTQEVVAALGRAPGLGPRQWAAGPPPEATRPPTGWDSGAAPSQDPHPEGQGSAALAPNAAATDIAEATAQIERLAAEIEALKVQAGGLTGAAGTAPSQGPAPPPPPPPAATPAATAQPAPPDGTPPMPGRMPPGLGGSPPQRMPQHTPQHTPPAKDAAQSPPEAPSREHPKSSGPQHSDQKGAAHWFAQASSWDWADPCWGKKSGTRGDGWSCAPDEWKSAASGNCHSAPSQGRAPTAADKTQAPGEWLWLYKNTTDYWRQCDEKWQKRLNMEFEQGTGKFTMEHAWTDRQGATYTTLYEIDLKKMEQTNLETVPPWGARDRNTTRQLIRASRRGNGSTGQ